MNKFKLTSFLSGLLLAFLVFVSTTAYAIQVGGAGNDNGDVSGRAFVQDSSIRFRANTAPSLGTGTIESSGTTVTGTNTLFQTELINGDIILANGEARRVTGISSDTSLTVNAQFTDALPASTPFEKSRLLMVVKDNGFVGIGIDNPSSALQVQGMLKTAVLPSAPTCDAQHEGELFYNGVNHFFCFCDGTSAKTVADPASACYGA